MGDNWRSFLHLSFPSEQAAGRFALLEAYFGWIAFIFPLKYNKQGTELWVVTSGCWVTLTPKLLTQCPVPVWALVSAFQQQLLHT